MIIRNQKKLNEADVSGIHRFMTTLADIIMKNVAMQGKLNPEDADIKKQSAEKFDIKENARENAPCMIFIDSTGVHVTRPLGSLSSVDIQKFVSNAIAYVKTITLNDYNNYKVYLYTKASERLVLIRILNVEDGVQKVEDVSDIYSIKIECKTDAEIKKYYDSNVWRDNEQFSSTIDRLVRSLKDIEIKAYEEGSVDTTPIDEIKVGDTIHSLEVSGDLIKVPKVTNYYVSSISSGDGIASLKPMTGDTSVEDAIEVSLDDIKSNYYNGEVDTESINGAYDNSCYLTLSIRKETGSGVGRIKEVEVYTSIDNIKSWLDSIRNDLKEMYVTPDARDKIFRKVNITAYDYDRKPYKVASLSFNNITGIRNTICKLLSDDKIYFIDAYDEAGVCHYQAERLSEKLEEEIKVFWNVMEDDFFETSKNTRMAVQINEDIDGPSWEAVLHLPYYDVNDADEMDSKNAEKKLSIKAPDETSAIKYVEQYIRQQAFKDETWKGAYIEKIEIITD